MIKTLVEELIQWFELLEWELLYSLHQIVQVEYMKITICLKGCPRFQNFYHFHEVLKFQSSSYKRGLRSFSINNKGSRFRNNLLCF